MTYQSVMASMLYTCDRNYTVTFQSDMASMLHTCDRTSGLDIRLVDAVARGASIFENLLAPQKLTGPQQTNWPLPQNQTCAMKKIFA